MPLEAQIMTLPINNLRITFMFLDGLDRVAIHVWANGEDHPLRYMGTVEGKDQLVHLMETVGIDHYLDASKETNSFYPWPVPEVIAMPCSPARLADALGHGFKELLEIDLKILSGESTNAAVASAPPKSLTVYSSATTAAAGLERTRGWFAGSNAPQPGTRIPRAVDNKQL